MMGISMGGMIAQEYALAYPDDLRSVTLACTYAAPGPFCSRMFSMWEDMAPVNGVPFIMRDVTLWAFTVPFFKEREDELREFEGEMAQMPMAVEPTSPSSASIQTHDTTGRVGADLGADAGARRRGGHPDPGQPVEGAARAHPRARPGARPAAGTPAAGSTRPSSTRRCSSSGAAADGPRRPPNPRRRRGDIVRRGTARRRRPGGTLPDRRDQPPPALRRAPAG